MGTGYTRNDTANNIADGNVINASDLDGEFDAVQAAFNASSGHSHDGTTGEGPKIDASGIADNAVALGTKTTGNYVASLTEGALIDLQNNSGEGATPTINVDLTELTDMTETAVGADELVILDGGTAQKRKAISEIPLSIFNNDSGFTSNTGDITGVSAGTGLSGGGSSGDVTLALDFSELTDMTGSASGTTEFILQDGTTESRKAASEIDLSIFNNNLSIDADNTTISNLEVDNLKSGVLDTDISSVATDDTTLASAKAIKTYVDAQVGGISTSVSSDSNPSLGGNLNVNTNNILFGDSASASDDRLTFGAGTDLSIYHTGGGDSFISVNNNKLSIYGENHSNLMATFEDDTAGSNVIKLYSGGSEKVTVTNTSTHIGALTSTTFSMSATGATFKADATFPTGTENIALGKDALDSITSGASSNVAIGVDALEANTDTDHNTAVGHSALKAFNNAGGLGFNTAVGADAMEATTTGVANTAVGYHALGNHTTGDQNVAVGYGALNDTAFTGEYNTAVGGGAGIALEDSDNNTLIGFNSGGSITTGSKNTIVGCYSGNNVASANTQALNITTTSNNVVLSDGDGNIRLHSEGNGRTTICGSRGPFGTHVSQPSGLVLHYETDTGIAVVGSFNKESDQNSGNSELLFYTNSSAADSTEKMRIDSDGGLRVGTTTKIFNTAASEQASINNPGTGNALTLQSTDITGGFPILYLSSTDTTTNQNAVTFQRIGSGGSSVGVGTISTTAASVAYNTSSDHRLKENVIDMTGAIARVKQLAPKRFNFIVDADTTVDGFLAHEAQTVVPEAVTGTHNEVDNDGNAVMQGIDQAKLVPLLTGALQEAITKIETLETKVAALEAGS